MEAAHIRGMIFVSVISSFEAVDSIQMTFSLNYMYLNCWAFVLYIPYEEASKFFVALYSLQSNAFFMVWKEPVT
jgi:hypothetical protein